MLSFGIERRTEHQNGARESGQEPLSQTLRYIARFEISELTPIPSLGTDCNLISSTQLYLLMKKKFLFYIFIVCLVSCASLVLTFIWGNEEPRETLQKMTGTFFIVGLGSFLAWFSLILIELRDLIANRE